MISPLRYAFIASFAMIVMASSAVAQSEQDFEQPTSGVGTTGCPSDVPVAASRQSITFDSNGREVSALLYEPRGVAASGAALVILHGRAAAEDTALLDSHAIQLASRGFAVILPFYEAVERARPEPERARAAHRVWRQIAIDAAEALAQDVNLPPQKVVLWGNARGGGVALAAALEPESPVAGAIGLNIGGVPQSDAKGKDRPFLLMHPARSSSLPPQQVRSMADAIREHGGQVQRIELDADIEAFDTAQWCRVMGETRRFLEQVAASERSRSTPAPVDQTH